MLPNLLLSSIDIPKISFNCFDATYMKHQWDCESTKQRMLEVKRTPVDLVRYKPLDFLEYWQFYSSLFHSQFGQENKYTIIQESVCAL